MFLYFFSGLGRIVRNETGLVGVNDIKGFFYLGRFILIKRMSDFQEKVWWWLSRDVLVTV
jgi:hypothetical protein